MTIGDKLRLLKRESGYTLAKIELESGIPVSQICGYLSGRRRPSLWVSVDLARCFSVTVDQLLDGVKRWTDSRWDSLDDYKPRWTLDDQGEVKEQPA